MGEGGGGKKGGTLVQNTRKKKRTTPHRKKRRLGVEQKKHWEDRKTSSRQPCPPAGRKQEANKKNGADKECETVTRIDFLCIDREKRPHTQ